MACGNALVNKVVNFKGLIIGVITIGNNGVWIL
jgi:hypothetical protein